MASCFGRRKELIVCMVSSNEKMSNAMILFLDFDGVLHPVNQNEMLFCRRNLLWKILRSCPVVRVVFTTSWRDDYTLDEMALFVTDGGGEDMISRFIDRTPNLESEARYGRRDLEIEQWMNNESYSGKWLAVDDMPEIFSSGYSNLHVVDGCIGLSEIDVSVIIERIQNSQVI